MQKVIHYCWFGGNPLPELAQKCIESWKKFCPDYEIKEWNESNYDVNKCAYIKDAYKAKKWAFVSDYARFDILYNHGGLYFDTDVELIRPIDDIIERGPFMGVENDRKLNVAPGLGLGAYKGMQFYKEILDVYNNMQFDDDGGKTLTVVMHTSNILRQKGLKYTDDIQQVAGIYIYPKDYFAPMNYLTGELNTTQNTRSIHHYHQSWLNEEEKNQYIKECKIRRRFGIDRGTKIIRITSLSYRIRGKIQKLGIKGTITFIKEKFIKNQIPKK